MSRINSNSISMCELLIYGFFFTSTLGCIVNYVFRRLLIRKVIVGSPMQVAMDDIELIFYAILCTIAVTIPIVVELLLDTIMRWKSSIDDHRERIFIVSVITIPGVMIFLFDLEDIPFIFSTFHAVQYMGCFGTVLSLCNKLIPNHFTTSKMAFVQFFFTLGGFVSMYGFGRSPTSWPNISVLFVTPLSLGSFLYFVYQWLSSLGIGFTNKSISKIYNMTVNEITCLLYILCTFLTIIVIPGIAAASRLFIWESFDLPIILIFVYSLVGFSLLPGCIPGRIARYSFMVAERNMAQEQASKRAALRYLSHEMRSPLNVVCSGVAFVLQDLEHMHVGGDVIENLLDVRNASEAAVALLDDFLNFEKMESGLFQLKKKYVAVSDIVSSILKPLGIFARQKGLHFDIEEAPDDSNIVGGDLSSIALYVDSNKLQQVVWKYSYIYTSIL